MKSWIENYLKGREIKRVIKVKDGKSEWREVKNGIQQGSVLAPITFSVNLNDMIERASNYISLFADDAKLFRKKRSHKDCREI